MHNLRQKLHPLKRLLPLLPALALILIALTQIYQSRMRQTLVADKGGGFGMFSSVDQWNHRTVLAYLIDGNRERRIPPASSRAGYDQIYRTVTAPTPSRLRSLAHKIGRNASSGGMAADAVRVEVWKTTFDSQTNQAHRIKLTQATVEMDPPHAQ